MLGERRRGSSVPPAPPFELSHVGTRDYIRLMEDAPKVHSETREEWRAWLAGRGHIRSAWLVSWRRHTGRPAVAYGDAVSEALAVGWVDSVQRKIDDDRSMLYFAQRKTGSGWARPNKERIERLEREGLMTPAGRAIIDAAKADGSWSLLDDVENLVVPPDLAAALDGHPPAAEHWADFPRSAKRGILEWIVQAKRPETREKRIATTAELAARNERANQWTPKSER